MNSPESAVSPKRRSRLQTLFRISAGALLLFLIVGFLTRRMIGDKLARSLDEQLSASGVYITWKSAAWVPGPGIQLHDVEIFRDAAKTDRFAMLSNVAAIKSARDWSRWDIFKVEARKAKLILDHGENETTLSDLHLDMLVQSGNVTLDELRGSFLGWTIEARGDYARPASPRSPTAATPPAEPPQPKTGLFGNIHLDWMRRVKAWGQVNPTGQAPAIRLEFHSDPESAAMKFALDLNGQSFRWRDHVWDKLGGSVKGVVGKETAPIEIEHVEIGYGGRTARLAGAVDLKGNVVHVSEFDSGVDVVALIHAFAPGAIGSSTTVTTKGQWNISGKGRIHLDALQASHWDGSIALDGDMTYAEGKTKVTLQRPGFILGMAGGVVTIGDFKAGLWGGHFSLPSSTIQMGEGATEPAFKTQAKLSDASLDAIAKSFGSTANQPGVLNADWKGGGNFHLASIAGGGSLNITQAEFYRIPLLGPLHLVFDQLTPGFGKDVASDLTANHSLEKSVLSIRNLNLDSKFTRIHANGDLELERNQAHLTAKAKIQGIVGLATGLLSSLLEMEGNGSPSDIKWSLKNLPGADLIKGAAGVVGKSGAAVIHGTGSALEATGDAATGTVKEAGKAVKGLFKLPGRVLPGGGK